MTPKQAELFRKRFFEVYKGLATYHQQSALDETPERRTLLGRRRIWHDTPSFTERCNTPIQGSAADITKLALTLLPERLSVYGAKLVACVHDEVVVECPAGVSPQVAQVVEDVMVASGNYVLHRVPMVVEVKIGDSWADK